MTKENQTVKTANLANCALAGPTPESIARALEAQQRERATFAYQTGIRVNGDDSIAQRN